MKFKLFCAVFAIGLVLIGSSIFASNMGFKIQRAMSNESGLNINYVALPYNFPDVTGAGTPSSGVPDGAVNAADVMYDIGWAECGQVSKWVPASQSWTNYAGGGREVPFTFGKGEPLLVKVSSPVSHVIVGSHDPAYSNSFDSQSGLNINYANVPYHFMDVTGAGTPSSGVPDGAINAADVMYDIGWAECGQVSKWVPASQSWTNYAGGGREVPFTFEVGEALLIKVSSSVVWSPSHY